MGVCIATFYARPPDLASLSEVVKLREELEKEKKQLATSLEKRRDRCRRAGAKILEEARNKAVKIVVNAKYHADEIRAQEPPGKRRVNDEAPLPVQPNKDILKADIGWVKNRIQEAKLHLLNHDPLSAPLLIDAKNLPSIRK
jgi:cell division septum initiation protein DivIVA